METPFSPLLFGKSFMKIRSAVPENGCLIFCGGRKKKQKKTSVKHIRIRALAARMRKLDPNTDPVIMAGPARGLH